MELLVNDSPALFAVVFNRAGEPVSSRAQLAVIDVPTMAILPQISALAAKEEILLQSYVRRSLSSPLSSRHFRNQLRLFASAYKEFRALASETWPQMQIIELTGARGKHQDALSLLVRDREFVGEVAHMGHGLQMWLQTIWFVVRSRGTDCVVLDEPDVYLHSDLQRKLMRCVDGRFKQVIVATHSVEIIAEAEPSSILVVDRSLAKSCFANSLKAAQSVIDRIGGVHNLHLTRLWKSRRFVMVEGEDVAVLRVLHHAIAPRADVPFDEIPHMSIGGWGGWSRAVGSGMAISNAMGERVHVYCILDRDYHPAEAVREREREATVAGVDLHIWRRKELENYLIAPSVVARVISRRLSSGKPPSPSAVAVALEAILEDLVQATTDAIATALQERGSGITVASANRQARERVSAARTVPGGLASLVSGKDVLSRLSAWSNEEYSVSFAPLAIAREMASDEIPDELASAIVAIDGGLALR